jgi:hypothetical protein
VSWSRRDSGCIALWVRQRDQQLGIVRLIARAFGSISDDEPADTGRPNAARPSRFDCNPALALLPIPPTHSQYRLPLRSKAFPGTLFATQPCKFPGTLFATQPCKWRAHCL